MFLKSVHSDLSKMFAASAWLFARLMKTSEVLMKFTDFTLQYLCLLPGFTIVDKYVKLL